jgi:hypothetical protein
VSAKGHWQTNRTCGEDMYPHGGDITNAPPLAITMRVSASAGPIDRASAIDGATASGFAVFADRLISHRRYDTRPENDARSRDATHGIINVLTIDDGRTCGLCICRGRQNRDCKKGKQCCHNFHVQLHLF